MKKGKGPGLDFEIDFLTASVQNTVSGDSFQTDVLRLNKADLKQTTKKNGWRFNWQTELDDNAKEVYKLTITNNPNIIQDYKAKQAGKKSVTKSVTSAKQKTVAFRQA